MIARRTLVNVCVFVGLSVLLILMGAGLVARAPRRFIQLGMGVALLVAGVVWAVRTQPTSASSRWRAS